MTTPHPATNPPDERPTCDADGCTNAGVFVGRYYDVGRGTVEYSYWCLIHGDDECGDE